MAEGALSRAEIIQMAEDTLRPLYAAQGLDFELERAKRQEQGRGKNVDKC